MSVTKLGRLLRRIRLESNIPMVVMADDFKITTPELSAIEHGRKETPSGFAEKLVNNYKFPSDKPFLSPEGKAFIQKIMDSNPNDDLDSETNRGN